MFPKKRNSQSKNLNIQERIRLQHLPPPIYNEHFAARLNNSCSIIPHHSLSILDSSEPEETKPKRPCKIPSFSLSSFSDHNMIIAESLFNEPMLKTPNQKSHQTRQFKFERSNMQLPQQQQSQPQPQYQQQQQFTTVNRNNSSISAFLQLELDVNKNIFTTEQNNQLPVPPATHYGSHRTNFKQENQQYDSFFQESCNNRDDNFNFSLNSNESNMPPNDFDFLSSENSTQLFPDCLSPEMAHNIQQPTRVKQSLAQWTQNAKIKTLKTIPVARFHSSPSVRYVKLSAHLLPGLDIPPNKED